MHSQLRERIRLLRARLQELTKNLTADEVATLEHLLKKVLP